ncbi:DnaD domain protein [Fructobacillus durionis]|uniref:Replicative DNA helicase loader DnaB n=1 Tax=Fructobacillus durionis TaxID=283737 RepID=A0A1I1DVP9_9LACO|nr:DnaD domain protein [Fructobacillus durionis]SFB78961.1 replicative DNA helicase loader DnaB [Fructobacillus durionis]
MVDSVENFQAAKPLVIDQSSSIQPEDLSVLFNLYLPFLGAKAYALYQFFYEEKKGAGQVPASFQNHYLILDSLSLSAPDFVRARKALEGLALLKSYQGQQMGQEKMRYVLQKPLSAAAFFKEDLLSGLLFHYVGEERYLALAKRYQQNAGPRLNAEQDVSASFLSVFDLPESSQKPKVALNDQAAERPRTGFSQLSFDFDGMAELVHGTTVDKIQKARELILTQQVLYGLNEAEMATAVTRSINLDDHEVNKQAFLAYLAQTWASKKQEKQLAEMEKSPAVDSKEQPVAQPAQRTGNKKLAGLYRAANELSPIDFIWQIKQQNSGYVTQNERRMLNDLVANRILPVPAINMLTYLILVDMDQADLKRNLLDTIANSWAKAGVRTAEDAFAAIMAHNKKSKERTSQPKSGWNRQPVKKEPAFTSNEAASQQKVDSDAVKDALKLMKNYKTKD